MQCGRTRVAFLLAATCLIGISLSGREAAAEPLVTQGIGASTCSKLTADLKPSEGLTNPVNLMLYSWVQGYLSAANVSLLEAGGKHVDINAIDEGKILSEVQTYCEANPDGRPVTAIDELIRKAAKLKAKWENGTVSWDG